MVRVTQIKVASGKTLAQMELLFRERAAQLRRGVLEKVADDIIRFSPVDTGTYIMAHAARGAESDAEADRSSRGRVRGRNAGQFRALALGNLKRSVASAALQSAGEVWIQNRSEHAERVETLGWSAPLFGNPNASGRGPYHVYRNARGRVPAHVRSTAREMGFETR